MAESLRAEATKLRESAHSILDAASRLDHEADVLDASSADSGLDALGELRGVKKSKLKVPAWPHFDEEVVSAVAATLRSGKPNQWGGKHVTAFADECAAYFGSKYAVANANGSTALELAMKALEVGPGDEVIVTPRSFIISATVPILSGATAVFCDIDDTGNVTAELIKAEITPKTKAVIVVHMGGHPCEMDEIVELCKENNVYLVEDCSQSHGAKYKGKHVGTFGQIGTWSCCQDKIMTTGGEGGICATDDEELFKKMWSYKDHGRSTYLKTAAEKKERKNLSAAHSNPPWNRSPPMHRSLYQVEAGI